MILPHDEPDSPKATQVHHRHKGKLGQTLSRKFLRCRSFHFPAGSGPILYTIKLLSGGPWKEVILSRKEVRNFASKTSFLLSRGCLTPELVPEKTRQNSGQPLGKNGIAGKKSLSLPVG